MTEDQLKQELKDSLLSSSSPPSLGTMGCHVVLMEEGQILPTLLDDLVKIATRFSDQRVKEAIAESHIRELESLREYIGELAETKDRYYIEIDGWAQERLKKFGSEAVTPPEQSADGNARGTSEPPDCPHKDINYYDHLDSYDPPYDGTDIHWEWSCEDCGEVFAEGDGYMKPPSLKTIREALSNQQKPRSNQPPDAKHKN